MIDSLLLNSETVRAVALNALSSARQYQIRAVLTKLHKRLRDLRGVKQGEEEEAELD